MTAPDELLIGLDIGGTALKAVSVRADGRDVERLVVPAGRTLDRAKLLATLVQTVQTLARGERVSRIGCAVGGVVRADGSMPADATNLTELAETPLAPLFTAVLGAPCHVLNDARAAIHGEAWLGAARGLSDVLLITLGTGIGCGLMLGGRVRDGAHGGAGEMGSWSKGVDTLDVVASPVHVERRSGRRLGDMVLTGSIDTHGAAALDAIGQSLASAHMLLDLDTIVLGGSIASIGEPLRAAIEAAFRRHCPPALHHGANIVTSALGAHAGAIGAVAPTALERA
jgi:glucokinase